MFYTKKTRLRRNNVNDSTALSADQVEKEKKSAIKRISNTAYRVLRTVEDETSTKERPRTAHTQEEKNIQKSTTEEIQTQLYTTIAKTNTKDTESNSGWTSQERFNEIQRCDK